MSSTGRTSTSPHTASGTRRRDLLGALRGVHVDEVEAREVLLELGERAVGHHRAPLRGGHPARERRVGEALRGDQLPRVGELAMEPEVVDAEPRPLLGGQGLPALRELGVRVQQDHELHGGPPGDRKKSSRGCRDPGRGLDTPTRTATSQEEPMTTMTENRTDTDAILATLDETARRDRGRGRRAGARDLRARHRRRSTWRPRSCRAPARGRRRSPRWAAGSPPSRPRRSSSTASRRCHVDGDVAFVHTLTSLTGRKGGDSRCGSGRPTACAGSRAAGVIVHQHESVPFHMDGSFRAAVGLQP